ncbi:phospholipase D family protein [Falsihalocynthiibacter sp. SS001]|uniref:phospholipase D family protein n=1 Tax=Falsihalocynthiibacter sp. SS001 TaxID=3349698 RepID=UPI0036D2F58A
MKLVRIFFGIALSIWLIAFAFRILFSVPNSENRSYSLAIPASVETTIGSFVLAKQLGNAGKSGVTQLAEGPAAFAARIRLAEVAQASIDARYYIWQDDLTGLLLLESLYEAAERGVRVRLLLDDNGTPNLDLEIAQMTAHPNIEVRIFNPFILRKPRLVSFLLDFNRLNRRMHNKSFTVDGAVTIVGGRNIGDIYFSRNEHVNYFDFDLIAFGDAANDVSEDFDLYWASDSAVAAEDVLPPYDASQSPLFDSVAFQRSLPGGTEFDEAIHEMKILEHLTDPKYGFEWAEIELVSDSPAKGLGPIPQSELLNSKLLEILPTPKASVDLVSAYFIPSGTVGDLLTSWAEKGLKVRTLTNAQESTDVLPVHSGYIRYRPKLIDAGVGVYELKTTLEPRTLSNQMGLTGESRSSLHAKTFVIDGVEVFVGSFNFDPRSANLNTEMGFLVKGKSLARFVSEVLNQNLDEWAYVVTASNDGNLIWTEESSNSEKVVHEIEPKTTVFSRALVVMIGWLPIQWLL